MVRTRQPLGRETARQKTALTERTCSPVRKVRQILARAVPARPFWRPIVIAVIFEVIPTDQGKAEYLTIAADLKKHLLEIPGFISIERFQSLAEPKKILSLSFWEDEASVALWRNLEAHRSAQAKGRDMLFHDYRIRVGAIDRDYSKKSREQAPLDSGTLDLEAD